MEPEHKEMTRDLIRLALAFTPISNLLTIATFGHKWIVKKHWPKQKTI